MSSMESYKDLLAALLSQPLVRSVQTPRSIGSGWGSGDRHYREVIGGSFRLYGGEAWLDSAARPINDQYALLSSVWMLLGKNDPSPLLMVNPHGKGFSDAGGALCAAFGHRLRHGVDQLDMIVDLIRRDETSRRALAMIGRVSDLIEEPLDFPCASLIHCFRRERGLSVIVYMRSQSLFSVFPYDAINFWYIASYVAWRLEVPVDFVHFAFGSVHVYDSEAASVRRLLDDEAALFRPPPCLQFDQLEPLYNQMVVLASKGDDLRRLFPEI